MVGKRPWGFPRFFAFKEFCLKLQGEAVVILATKPLPFTYFTVQKLSLFNRRDTLHQKSFWVKSKIGEGCSIF